jgi:hypothetical protein
MCDHEGQACPRHCRCECMNCQFRDEDVRWNTGSHRYDYSTGDEDRDGPQS